MDIRGARLIAWGLVMIAGAVVYGASLIARGGDPYVGGIILLISAINDDCRLH
jgi:hypothetical protein